MEQIERTAENMKNNIKETTTDIWPLIKNNIENIQNNTFSNFSLDNFFFHSKCRRTRTRTRTRTRYRIS